MTDYDQNKQTRANTRIHPPPPSGAFTNQIPLRERAIARCIFLEQSWIKPTEAPPGPPGWFIRSQCSGCWPSPTIGLKVKINCFGAPDPSSNLSKAVILLWEQAVSATAARKCYHRPHCGRAGPRTPTALHIRAPVQHSCCFEALLRKSSNLSTVIIL